jgi:hypothetical protein
MEPPGHWEGMKVPKSKAGRLALAVISTWPLVWMVIFFVFFKSQVLPGSGVEPDSALTLRVVAVHFITMAIVVVLVPLCVFLVMRSDRIVRKGLWILALFFFNLVALPVFVITYVCRNAPRAAQVSGA